MEEVARVVLALEQGEVAEEIMHFLDRSGHARVVGSASDGRQLREAIRQLEALGLEVWMIHEGGTQPGADLRNARTGEVYWKTAAEDVGRGVAADILTSSPGAEFWGPSGGVRDANGRAVTVGTGSTNFLAWWDGDPLREIVDPAATKGALDEVMPDGLDLLDVVDTATSPKGALADLLTGSEWIIDLPTAPEDAAAAVEAFLGAEEVIVERMTKKGMREFDARGAVVRLSSAPREGGSRLELLLKHGFAYDSSMMGMDEPYELVSNGKPTGIVELPVEWILDDYPYFGASVSGALPSPEEVIKVYRDEFDAAHNEGTLLMLTFHPHVIGHRSRMKHLDQLVAYMKSRPRVWFATAEQIANYVKTRLVSE